MRGCLAGTRAAQCLARLHPHTRAVSSIHGPRIADVLNEKAGEQSSSALSIGGFVRTVRRQKNIAFAAVGDGSSFENLQAVLRPEQAASLSTGSAVKLTGNYTSSLPGKRQDSELRVSDALVLGDNDSVAYPVQKKYHTAEFLRTLPHLRSRTAHNSLLLRLRSRMIAQAVRFFDEHGYIQTHPPIITSSDCEGAGEAFTVQAYGPRNSENATQSKESAPGSFFGAPKYLTVSSQLHLEALAQSVGRVWTLSPTFRAEQSDTARHLSEFYMLEAEACFVERLSDIMAVVEALVRSMAADLMERNFGNDLVASHQARGREENAGQPIDLEARWKGLLMPHWPRVTYHQAVTMIRTATAEGTADFGKQVDATSGLETEHERFIAKSLGRGGPVFVTDYPAAIKPFYMPPSAEDAPDLGPVPTVSCFDLLLPDVCEVVGGSMREHRLDALEANIRTKGLGGGAGTSLDWYLDLRRYGSAPHGGFGLGFDRLLAYLAGVHNIRDVVTFPRWHGRCVC